MFVDQQRDMCLFVMNSNVLIKNEKAINTRTCFHLSDLLLYEEKQGYAPMAPDGRIGGNGASKITLNNKTYVIVSKSGKLPGLLDHKNDFCLVSKFDTETWGCEYYSEQPETKPTSDTPMHYSLLMNVKGAESALHGHAIEKEDVARALGVPCSTEETLFSTPADTKAMFTLLEEYEYPEWKIFVRKNHGFYILGKDLDECRDVMDNQLVAKQLSL